MEKECPKQKGLRQTHQGSRNKEAGGLRRNHEFKKEKKIEVILRFDGARRECRRFPRVLKNEAYEKRMNCGLQKTG